MRTRDDLLYGLNVFVFFQEIVCQKNTVSAPTSSFVPLHTHITLRYVALQYVFTQHLTPRASRVQLHI